MSTLLARSAVLAVAILATCACLLFAEAPAVRAGGAERKLQRGISKALAENNIEAAKKGTEILVGRNSEDAFEALVPLLPQLSVEVSEDWLVEQIKRFDVELMSDILPKLVTSKKVHPDAASFAVWIAPKLGGEVHSAVFEASLRSPFHVVSRAALTDFVDDPTKAGVKLLVERLADDELPRVLRSEITWALQAVTGLDTELGEDWQRWWKANGETFDPKAPAEGGATATARRKPDDAPEFFGEKIVANRVVFVIDVSTSMKLWDRSPESKEDSGKENWQARQRIVRTRAQLVNALGKIPDKSYFGVVAFGSNNLLYSDGELVVSSKSSRRRAQKWAGNLQANGSSTKTLDGLEAAFGIPGIDTIVLLSDGAPTGRNGTSQEQMKECIERVEALNRIREITIHAFGFDGKGLPPGQYEWPPAPPRDPNAPEPPTPEEFQQFLRDLAEGNDGNYTSIR